MWQGPISECCGQNVVGLVGWVQGGASIVQLELGFGWELVGTDGCVNVPTPGLRFILILCIDSEFDLGCC